MIATGQTARSNKRRSASFVSSRRRDARPPCIDFWKINCLKDIGRCLKRYLWNVSNMQSMVKKSFFFRRIGIRFPDVGFGYISIGMADHRSAWKQPRTGKIWNKTKKGPYKKPRRETQRGRRSYGTAKSTGSIGRKSRWSVSSYPCLRQQRPRCKDWEPPPKTIHCNDR